MATELITRNESVKLNVKLRHAYEANHSTYSMNESITDRDAMRSEISLLIVDVTNFLNGNQSDDNGWLFCS
jgi:hypothetical protein